jgi:hypothetical protein
LRICRTHWLAAIRATFFENKQKQNGGPPMLNLNGEQIDLLTQELTKANSINQPETSITISTETNGKIHDRSISLTPRMDSRHVKTEEKRFFSRQRSRSTSANVDRTSLKTSNRNTPSLTTKQRHHLSRIDQT